MGWPKGKKRNPVVRSENKQGQEHVIAVVKSPRVSKALSKGSSKDAVEKMNEEIQREEAKVKYKPKTEGGRFPSQFVIKGDDRLSYISDLMAEHFGFEVCGFRENVTSWNFPKAIGNPLKRHSVTRQYFYEKIMVDVFDAGTPVSDIKRIKAHLEALGFKYTYVLGNEELDAKTIFVDRLKRSPEEVISKVRVPQNLAEAGYAGHSVEMR